MVEIRELNGKPVKKVKPIPPQPPPCKPRPIEVKTECCPAPISPRVEMRLRKIAAEAVDTLEKKIESELIEAAERATEAAERAEDVAESMRSALDNMQAQIDEIEQSIPDMLPYETSHVSSAIANIGTNYYMQITELNTREEMVRWVGNDHGGGGQRPTYGWITKDNQVEVFTYDEHPVEMSQVYYQADGSLAGFVIEAPIKV